MSECDPLDTVSARENSEDFELKLAATSALSGLAANLSRVNNNLNLNNLDVNRFSIDEINSSSARPGATPEKPFGL
jgi:hypothetical protein